MSEMGGERWNAECSFERERLVELALGVLAGAERAELVDHLARCAACRAELGDLVQVADSLVQAVPEEEPPGGFEAAILERVASVESEPGSSPGGSSGFGRGDDEPESLRLARRLSSRRRRARPLLLGAAAAVAVLAAAFAVGRGTAPSQRAPVPTALDAEYAHTLRTLGGRALLAGELRAPNGKRVGEAFVYQGVHPWPSWLFVQATSPDPPGRERVVVMDASGRVLVRLSDLAYKGGTGSWGREVRLPSHLRLPLRVEVIWSTGGVSSGSVTG
jgi:anti-sigma factor RsiW